MSDVIMSEVKMTAVIMSELKLPKLPTEVLFQLLNFYSVIIFLINMAEFSSLYSQADADVYVYIIFKGEVQ